jgi:hypothetical protein
VKQTLRVRLLEFDVFTYLLTSVTCSKNYDLLTYLLVGHVQNLVVSHTG